MTKLKRLAKIDAGLDAVLGSMLAGYQHGFVLELTKWWCENEAEYEAQGLDFDSFIDHRLKGAWWIFSHRN